MKTQPCKGSDHISHGTRRSVTDVITSVLIRNNIYRHVATARSGTACIANISIMFIGSCQTYIHIYITYVHTRCVCLCLCSKQGRIQKKNSEGVLGTRGAEDESPQATRPRRRTRRGGWGGGVALPSRLGGLGERRELPQRGPGQSPGRKRIWCTLPLSESPS